MRIKAWEIGAVTGAGLLTALAFPKFELIFLGWISLIPLLFVLPGKKPSQSFLLGMIAGSAFYLVLLYWIPEVPAHYGGLSVSFSLLIYFLFAVFLSLFWAFFCLVFSFINRLSQALALLLAPFIWVAFEYIPTHLLTGFPWGLLGYGQYKNLYFIQMSAITGVYGLSFILILFQSMFVLSMRSKKRTPFIATIGLVLCIHIGGYFGLKSITPTEYTFKGAVVQGNVSSEIQWENTTTQEIRDIFEQHMELSRQAFTQGAHIIIWPELSVPLCFSCYSSLYQDFIEHLHQFVQETGCYYLLGTYETASSEENIHYYNSAICLSPQLTTSQYNKMHLVPFGEYTPYKSIFSFISNFTHAIGELTPGDHYTFHNFEGHKFGSPICYEIIFPDLVRRFPKNGAEFLVTITNDGWYGKSAAPFQHFAIAVIRAVENRRFLLRSATTGISGIIDPYGRILKKSKLNEKTFLTENITPITSTTIYTRTGDWLAFVSLTISCIFLILSFIKKKNGQQRTNLKGQSV